MANVEKAMADAAPGELVRQLAQRPSVAVLTGAGVSAESGVPTFRDAQCGLWARYDPMALATPQAFERDPALVWQWYRWRRELIAVAAPNAGHRALAGLEDLLDEFTLITQNVDGLHRAAGSRAVLELHGDINRTICSRERIPVNDDPASGEPPRCPRCGAPGRPDVVWFGEALPAATLEKAFDAARTCELFFSIGTSTTVEPAASLPWVALESGATVVEINPQRTPLSGHAHYALAGQFGEMLASLVREAFGQRV